MRLLTIAGIQVDADAVPRETLVARELQYRTTQAGRPLTTAEKFGVVEYVDKAKGLDVYKLDGKTFDLSAPLPTTADLLPGAIADVTRERFNQAGAAAGKLAGLVPPEYRAAAVVLVAVAGLFGAAYLVRSFK